MAARPRRSVLVAAVVAALAGEPASVRAQPGSMAGMAMDSPAEMHIPGMGRPDGPASTAPADGETLTASPPTLSLAFRRPVQLQSLQLFDTTGARVPIGAEPTQPTRLVSTPLPILPPDRYEARWRALCADGRSASGSIRFTVR